jgi:hypothetical protein
MGEVVNLRRVKKARERAAAAGQAAANRVKFGRTAAEKAADASAEAHRQARLDGKELTGPGGEKP